MQKHAARRTHFDVRLEWGGVLKSWAVPKGPSLDPREKRLAVHVEDHPIEYAEFEGRIPEGEYGAGPVIVWDRGTWVPYVPSEDAADEEIEEWYRAGKLEFELFGERLRGKWGLVRMRGSRPGDAAGKGPWLLVKKKDAYAVPGRDVVAEYRTSVLSGRTLEEVEAEARGDAGAGARRGRAADRTPASRGARKRGSAAGSLAGRRSGRGSASAARRGAVAAEAPDVRPMLAESATRWPEGPGWILEEKIDGVRVIVRAEAAGVRLLSRTGQRLERAFPEIADAVRRWAETAGAAFVADGELGVRDAGGRARFALVQPRLQLKAPVEVEAAARATPATLFAFDLLWANGLRFADRPLRERKRALRELLAFAPPGVEEVPWWETNGVRVEEVRARALREGWEGVVAKRAEAPYRSGRRSRDWLKLKLTRSEEFVLVGWTDPQAGRAGFGALLLGVYDAGGRLRYAGRVGTGFDARALRELAAEVRRLERPTSPCVDPPDEPGLHWIEPRLVAQVRFQEWTPDGRLREPVFEGLRADKAAAEVRLAPAAPEPAGPPEDPQREALLDELERAESADRPLRVEVEGVELTLTNLAKVLWPEDGLTKGDLLRYYVRVSPWILPVLADRPLALERYPDGIDGEAFWQQRVPEGAPAGLRTVEVEHEGERAPRLVGGSLATLLYTTQLAAIAQHPWASRVGSLEFADYAVLDLDPGPEVAFDGVRDVARWVRDELDALGLDGAVKTSGGRGLHVVLPFASGVPHEAARLVAQLVAARVVRRNRAAVTVERAKKRRPPQKVYLDCFQNDYGKTIASAYSVRARPGAPVSVPLRWEELDDRFEPSDFRMPDVWERFATVPDLWAEASRRPNRVEDVLARIGGAGR